MGKSKSAAKNRNSSLPKAPWLYINDTTCHDVFSAEIVDNLMSFIPKADVSLPVKPDHCHLPGRWKQLANSPDDTLAIFVERELDLTYALQSTNTLREKAIELGTNFASVKVTRASPAEEDGGSLDWGTNHLEVDTTHLTARDAAEKIFKWLFKVLTVPETLYLVPEADMRATDDKNFADYAYCPINESRKHRKDAKIQFVALIVSKPEVGPDQRLQWKVVDRTGEANFFFQWRGADSKATWDWVLKLQPGERKALPRMPMLHIKEKKRIQVIKAPFRGVAAVVSGAGVAVKGFGKGLCWVGEKVHLGQSEQWVAEADLDKNGKIRAKRNQGYGAADNHEKREVKIFNEKGEKMWKDDDDTASTTAGSIYDEKAAKEFC